MAPERERIAAALAKAIPHLDQAQCRRIAARSSLIEAPDGARLFAPGDSVQTYILPVDGTVRVDHVGASGRTIVLYRVNPGESCIMTTSGILSGTPYESWGYAEGPVTAIAMPAGTFLDLVETETAFRHMALGVFARRMHELVEVIDELMLHRVDLRLALHLANRGDTVRTTHQALAEEFGSAREVISRILKDFERRGWIALQRGEIRVNEPGALKGFADGRLM